LRAAERCAECAGGSAWASGTRALPIALLLGLALLGCARSRLRVFGVDTREFGRVEVLAPRQAPVGFAFLFSAAVGVERDDRHAAAELARDGWAVGLVNTRVALGWIARRHAHCAELAGPLEWVSRNAENRLGLAAYREPVLLGRGAGATLARAALEQAPPLAFAAGAGVEPEALGEIEDRLCAADGSPTPARRWRVASGDGAAQPVIVYRSALAEIEAALAAGSSDSLADLPLVELPAAQPTGVLAVIYTGDGGWRDLDRSVGEWLSAHGISVIGVDSLRYFWSPRSPEQTAKDLARILEHYAAVWGTSRVALIGYSFGAGVLPFAINRLPGPLREQIALLTLLAPGRAADFEVHLEGWLGAPPSGKALPVLPEIQRIDPGRIQCVFGAAEESESLCTLPELAGAELVRLRGHHHFDRDYAGLAARIHARLFQRGSRPAGPPAISAAICARISGAGSPRG
jgi:type IV secretory pathway VirJ component